MCARESGNGRAERGGEGAAPSRAPGTFGWQGSPLGAKRLCTGEVPGKTISAAFYIAHCVQRTPRQPVARAQTGPSP